MLKKVTLYSKLGKENEYKAFVTCFSNSLSNFVSQPVQKYPNIFPKDSFWDK